MPINLRAISITLVLAGIIPTHAFAAAPQDKSAAVLLRGAKQWVEKDRADLAKTLLEKLILIEPNSPEGLFMLGKIELLHGKPHEALPYLDKLEKTSPNHPRTRELRDAYSKATDNTPTLGKMRSLAQTGKTAEAGNMLAQLVELESRSQDPKQLASALSGYEYLAKLPNVDVQRLQAGWQSGLRKYPNNTDKLAAIQRYLAIYPNDSKVIKLLGDTQRSIAEQSIMTKRANSVTKRAKISKPAKVVTQKQAKVAEAAVTKQAAEMSSAEEADIEARSNAMDAIDDGKLDVAETALMDLLKRRPDDQIVLGGLGLIKQDQGKPDEAELWFERALKISNGDSNATRWQSLLTTARFWKHMRAADELLEARKLPEAEVAVQQALALQANEPNGLALLGNIKMAENRLDEAEQLYRDALKEEGYNVSAIRGLITLLSRTQRSAEALELVEQVHQRYAKELDKNPVSQASLLREEAELYIAAHRPSHAIQALEMAVLLSPKDPWSRFTLAKLYISLGLTPLGKQIMQEGVALAPKDPDMLYSNALVLISLNEYAAGLESLSLIPEAERTPVMQETWNRALMQYYFQQAEDQLAQGNRKEALRIMSVAETQARGSYAATEQVAEGWFRLGLQAQGLSAMRKLPQPVPLQTQIYFASLLSRAKKDAELTEFLPTLRIPDGVDEVSEKQRSTIRNIEFEMAGRQFDKLMNAGKTEQAQTLAKTVLSANQLSNADYFKFHRNYFSRAELPEDAIPLLNQEKEQYPNDLGIRWDLAYAYYQAKQNSNSEQELQELLSLTKGDDIDMRMRIARLQQSLGDASGARQTVDDLTHRFPNNTEVLLQAGSIAQAGGEYNQAMKYFQQTKELSAQKTAPSDAPLGLAQQSTQHDILLKLLPAKQLLNPPASRERAVVPVISSKESDQIYRSVLASDVKHEKYVANSPAARAEQEMDIIAERRTATIEAGLDIQSKTASSGTSTYNATEIPVRARFPIGYEAHGTVQIDKVDIDAGTLSPAFADAAVFGTIQANQFVPAQPLTPTASGASFALGYEQGSVQADIGVVGQGFPVRNIVGGIRKSGLLGQLSYSLNLSRRPETNSLLSYAGAKDPITGVTWGGVTDTGVALSLATKLGDVNAAGTASYGLLRGKNVQNNDRLYLRASLDQDIYTTDDMVLNVGVNANYTHSAKNESFFTFGHGGYYSPQSNLTFGLPVELNGRVDLLSYQLRANVSYSFTKEDSAAFYPNDPALQALAASRLAFPAGYTQAVYLGKTNSGFGYGLRGMVEYRTTPNIITGARFNVDRSAYYAPNSFLFYLRYAFKPETGSVKFPPTPITPYSQF